MAEIKVIRTGEGKFRVEVKEGTSQTSHEVMASSTDLQKYGGQADPERLIQASFEFLLEREPKESILRSFALPVIECYFPKYPTEIRKRRG